MLPHQPFVARRADYDLYRDVMTMPEYPEPFSDSLHPYLRWWRERCGIVEVTDEEILRARTAYWALVTRLDSMIGEILTALRENGLADNTLIVYSSDHGEQVGEHGLWWKQTFYERSVGVPGIITWPGVLPAGERCEPCGQRPRSTGDDARRARRTTVAPRPWSQLAAVAAR